MPDIHLFTGSRGKAKISARCCSAKLISGWKLEDKRKCGGKWSKVLLHLQTNESSRKGVQTVSSNPRTMYLTQCSYILPALDQKHKYWIIAFQKSNRILHVWTDWTHCSQVPEQCYMLWDIRLLAIAYHDTIRHCMLKECKWLMSRNSFSRRRASSLRGDIRRSCYFLLCPWWCHTLPSGQPEFGQDSLLVQVKAAVSQALVLLGMNIPELYKLLGVEEEEQEAVHEAYMVATHSCAREERLQVECSSSKECHGARPHQLDKSLSNLDESESMFGQFDDDQVAVRWSRLDEKMSYRNTNAVRRNKTTRLKRSSWKCLLIHWENWSLEQDPVLAGVRKKVKQRSRRAGFFVVSCIDNGNHTVKILRTPWNSWCFLCLVRKLFLAHQILSADLLWCEEILLILWEMPENHSSEDPPSTFDSTPNHGETIPACVYWDGSCWASAKEPIWE